jgi:hypothetical protein
LHPSWWEKWEEGTLGVRQNGVWGNKIKSPST